MKWLIDIPEKNCLALAWAKEFFAEFDTSKVDWIRIDLGRGKYKGAYGRCWYPNKKIPYYRLSVQVPGPFPDAIVTRQSPLYRQPDGRFPPTPPGMRRGDRVKDLRSGKEWIRLISETRLRSREEAIVWVLAHEAFHFLRHSKQIAGRNTEIEADRFADETLRFYLTGR